jgi:Holliday junction resolvase RusA-like endonuclease
MTLHSLFIEAIHPEVKCTPQGSKKGFSRKGSTKVAMVEMGKYHKPYREILVQAAKSAIDLRIKSTGQPWVPIKAPVAVYVTFEFTRPAHTRAEHPVAPACGDSDKLARSLLDALEISKVLDNDRYVVDLSVKKRWGTEHSTSAFVEWGDDGRY